MDSSVIPAWHSALQPFHYYATFVLMLAVYAVLVLLCTRAFLSDKEKIPIQLIDHFNKLILAASSIVLLVYLIELIIAWYSDYLYEQFAFLNRAVGLYWISYIAMLLTLFIPQFYWSKKFRRNIKFNWLVTIALLLNMWFERIAIIVTGMIRDW